MISPRFRCAVFSFPHLFVGLWDQQDQRWLYKNCALCPPRKSDVLLPAMWDHFQAWSKHYLPALTMDVLYTPGLPGVLSSLRSTQAFVQGLYHASLLKDPIAMFSPSWLEVWNFFRIHSASIPEPCGLPFHQLLAIDLGNHHWAVDNGILPDASLDPVYWKLSSARSLEDVENLAWALIHWDHPSSSASGR